VTLLIALLAAQDPPAVAVPKADAAPYRQALADVEEAARALETRDFSRAAELAGAVLADSRLRDDRRDCLLRLQNADGSYSAFRDFFPSRVRAEARLGLARDLETKGRIDAALAELRAARDDARRCRDRQIPRAGELADEIDARLARLQEELDRARRYDEKMRAAGQARLAGELDRARALLQEAHAIDPLRLDALVAMSTVDAAIAERDRPRGARSGRALALLLGVSFALGGAIALRAIFARNPGNPPSHPS
jgi:hypothetical protein